MIIRIFPKRMANEMHLHSFVANYLVQEVTNFMSSYHQEAVCLTFALTGRADGHKVHPYSNPALLALMVSQLRKDADNH